MAKRVDIAKIMAEADRLAQEKIPTEQELAKRFESDMARAEKAKKFLKRVREPVSRRKTSVKRRSK